VCKSTKADYLKLTTILREAKNAKNEGMSPRGKNGLRKIIDLSLAGYASWKTLIIF